MKSLATFTVLLAYATTAAAYVDPTTVDAADAAELDSIDEVRAKVRELFDSNPALNRHRHVFLAKKPWTVRCIQTAWERQLQGREEIMKFVVESRECDGLEKYFEQDDDPNTKVETIADEIEWFYAVKENWPKLKAKADDLACTSEIMETINLTDDKDEDSQDEADVFLDPSKFKMCNQAEEGDFSVLQSVKDAKRFKKEGTLNKWKNEIQILRNLSQGAMQRADRLDTVWENYKLGITDGHNKW